MIQIENGREGEDERDELQRSERNALSLSLPLPRSFPLIVTATTSDAVGIQSKPVGRLRATDDINDELLRG